MAIDQRIGNKVTKQIRREETAATRLEPYPYIGIIKKNLDPTRSGRLKVFIPDLGGDATNPQSWYTVSYASPFMGTTNTSRDGNRVPSPTNSFTNVAHTYGMWMIPPDLEVEVIVMFIGGDPNRGYWVGCVNSNLSKHMMPGLAGSLNVDGGLTGASDETKKTYRKGMQVPVVEFNENDKTAFNKSAFYNNPKPIHEYQYSVLKEQGLDRDPIRGAVSSSSQRETPSNVFGISTPGRPANDLAEDPRFISKVLSGEISESQYHTPTRKGGHSFVMDDGSTIGADQMIRLRTSAGHQIMMHDTANMLYISHAKGTTWIEMTDTGSLNIYSKGSINLRTEASLNFHSDGSMNFNAGGSFNVKVGGKTTIDTGSTFNLLAGSAINLGAGTSFGLKADSAVNIEAGTGTSIKSATKIALTAPSILENSGGDVTVAKPAELPMKQLNDTVYDETLGLYVVKLKALNTIVSIAPSHEPYPRLERYALTTAAPGTTDAGVDSSTTGLRPADKFKGSFDAVKNASGTSLSEGTRPLGAAGGASDKALRDQPQARTTIGNLSKDQLTAYYAQVGQSESSGNYSAENTLGFVGKYQFGYQALIDGGYVKSNVTSNSQLNDPNSWTGKDGITNKQSWLTSEGVQEQAMESFTKTNYDRMVQNGGVTADMSPEEVGGMLQVSHLLGATGAKNWRAGEGGSDAYGTTGEQYFQKGKYAASVLGAKMPAINAG